MDAVQTWGIFSFRFSFFSSVHFMLCFYGWYQHYYFYYYYKGLFAVWVLSR